MEENGIIILDEPEIHLHPDWQVKLAEIVVLIQKTYKMHILLTTHSPYFIDAIDVFSEKYGVETKYYLADIDEFTGANKVTDVTTNIEEIYAKLARPLQKLENLRGGFKNE